VRRSLPKNKPRSSPKGDYQAICSFCGQSWYRSQLFVDEAGNFVCPDEGEGLDSVALAREQVLCQDQWLRQGEHDAPRDPPVSTAGAPSMKTLTGAPTGGNGV
jgi:hypothetical protein